MANSISSAPWSSSALQQFLLCLIPVSSVSSGGARAQGG